jgi:glycolate oxidase FAD binding subunit
VLIEELVDKIKDHADRNAPLRIEGANSKAFYGRDISQLEVVSTQSLNQVISYEPSELVIRVQAGCTLMDVNRMLAEKQQMLAFEPPDFGGSTIGGAIASGIAGSRRPFVGAGRDFLLGLDLIDGRGEVFTFGGQVMKNVAGYDVSRLMAGAMGCLGVITEVSLKVLPRPESESFVMKDCLRSELLREMNKLSVMPEVTGLAWWQGQLYVRFSGSDATVKIRVSEFGGTAAPTNFWQDLDTMALFANTERLWKVSTQSMDTISGFEKASLIDWGGAQRWIADVDELAMEAPAYQTLVKTGDREANRFSALSPPVLALHQNLKATFDPKKILNPNKMYEGL